MADKKNRTPQRAGCACFFRKYLPAALRRGFNAMELMVVLGIVAITAGIAVPVYENYQSVSDFNMAVENIVQALRNAKTYAQANKNNTTWGVYAPEGTMFSGDVYALRNPANDEQYPVPASIDTSGIDEVYFSQIDGLPNVTGTITVRSNELGRSRDISIDENGFITLGGIMQLSAQSSASSGASADDFRSSAESSADGSVESAGTGGSSGNSASSLSSQRSSSAGGVASSAMQSASANDSLSSAASSAGGGDGAIGCDERFALNGNAIINRGSSDITLKVLGSDITYGNNGPRVDVRVSGSLDGGASWQNMFSGRAVVGGEEQVLTNVPDGTPLILNINGRYSWFFNRTYRSDTSPSHVLILRKGDKLPDVVPFNGQKPLSVLMARYVDKTGRVSIGTKDVVFLAELGTLGTSSMDFQDAVILVTFNERQGSCSDPSNPRLKISYNRFDDNRSHARTISAGPQGTLFTQEQWIPLVDNAGNTIVDNGIVRTANGLAIERGNGWVRILHAGEPEARRTSIIDARVLFNHASITSTDNGTGTDATEHPRDGVINDGADGDEFVNGPNAKSMIFATRTTATDSDSVILHWQAGEVPDASSSSFSSVSSAADTPAGSAGSSAASIDTCAVPFHITTDGTLINEDKADITLRIAGSYGTYGLRGPQTNIRIRISFDSGVTWQPLFGYRSLRGGEIAVFHNVPADSRILLDVDGRYSWVFHTTARSNAGDGRVRLARRGQVLANVPTLLGRSTLKGFFSGLLSSGVRANVGSREVLFAAELGDIDDTADYQDAVGILSIDKPAGTAGCSTVLAGSTSSALSTSSSSSSSSRISSSVGSSVSSAAGEMVDSDGDGVMERDDLCPGTVIPEAVPTEYLGFNRFALTGLKKPGTRTIFRTGPTKSVSNYSIADTRGCSCSQLLDTVDGKMNNRFSRFPSLSLVMRNLFPFYSLSSKQFGCPQSLLELISGSTSQ